MKRSRNSQSSTFEICMAQRDTGGLIIHSTVIRTVQGRGRAEMVVDTLMNHLTENEKCAGISYYLK